MEHISVTPIPALAASRTGDLDDDSATKTGASSPTMADEEKNVKFGAASEKDTTDSGSAVVTAKSRGVFDMEMLAKRLNTKYKIFLYGGFLLLAYALSLDQATGGIYLTTATSVSFEAHAALSTISALKSIFQAVSQPPIAKIADVAGRVEAYCVCVFLYALGYVVVASASSIYAYGAGSAINILGISGLFLLQNIIISDISSLRNRVWWTIFPSIPSIINTWVSGNVAGSLLSNSDYAWRWGYGLYTIVTPVLAIPIIAVLTISMRARKTDADYEKPPKRIQSSLRKTCVHLFWQLDLVGFLLFVAGAALVLLTITLANSRTARWSDAHSIAMLTIGGLSCIAFVVWERYFAKHPLLPVSLLANRTVICALLIALFHPMSGRIAGGFFVTFLRVAANRDVLTTTRLGYIPSMSGMVSAVAVSQAIRYTRRIKPFICLGFVIQILALGLMVRFRQSTNSTAEIAVVQVLRGLGSGMVPFPTQAIIQCKSKHEHLASITAGWLVVYYLSGGIGSAIGGAIWTNMVPRKIDQYMEDATLRQAAYSNPIGFIRNWGPETAPRIALSRAQDEAQRTIVIVGCCVSVLALIVALILDNPRLPDTQSMEDAECDGYKEKTTAAADIAYPKTAKGRFMAFRDKAGSWYRAE